MTPITRHPIPPKPKQSDKKLLLETLLILTRRKIREPRKTNTL